MRSTKARPRRGDAQGLVTVYGHESRPTQDDASMKARWARWQREPPGQPAATLTP